MYFCHLKTGKIYDFQGLCVMEATGEVGVMYQPFDSDTVVVRLATEFFDTERFKVVETEPGVTLSELQELYSASYPDKTVVSTWGDKEEKVNFVEKAVKTTVKEMSDNPAAGEDNIFVGDNEDHFDITQENPNPELDIAEVPAARLPKVHEVGIKPRPATLQGIEKETTDG